jgi:hypothetical protein
MSDRPESEAPGPPPRGPRPGCGPRGADDQELAARLAASFEEQWPALAEYMRRPLMYVLDAEGRPVAEPRTVPWGIWMEQHLPPAYPVGHPESRQLADDTLGRYRVSTVFLGIDYAFLGGPPILWETMIFGDAVPVVLGGRVSLYHEEVDEDSQWRYRSRGDALDGHAAAVESVKLRVAAEEAER